MIKQRLPSYSSSPNFSILNDLNMLDQPLEDDLGLYNCENGVITPDLFEDLFVWHTNSSIYSDVQKMESVDTDLEICGNLIADSDFFDAADIKSEIRNIDCMWSATQTPVMSTSPSNSLINATAVPFAATQSVKQEPDCITAAKTEARTEVVASSQVQQQNDAKTAEIKKEPHDDDDYEQQLLQHNILNSRTVQHSQQQKEECNEHIPPGTSLLRKSNLQHQHKRQQQQKTLLIPKIETADFVNERDVAVTATTAAYGRPDTPHSLDDECNGSSGFKHNVDLHACIMGSNNIALRHSDSKNLIKNISDELQDTSKSQIDTRLGNDEPSLDEVYDVIKCYDSEEEEEESIECDSSYGADSSRYIDSLSYSAGSPSQDSHCGSSKSGDGSHHRLHHTMQPYHSDHSYTRCKDGMDDLSPNLETPSDSDEEIDVVSINDKKLPTNPSDKDRRALQSKVAHKFSTARVVKTVHGLRTIPPRRRTSYVMPYTPASSSPVKSVANTRYPSPASTPYHNQYTSSNTTTTKYIQQLAVLSDGTTAPINVLSSEKLLTASRKRTLVAGGIEYVLPPSKKNRGKKSSLSKYQSSSPASIVALKRHYSVDEADTIEKRNLHNDMERQRRIGLKNLFEALKKQIPSIKDKERAPKVNILREAAKLCEALTREDHILSEQKAILQEQLRKRKELLARLRAE